MNILDLVFAAICGFFLLRGIFKGLLVEIAAVLGLVLGFFLANSHHQTLAPYIQRGIDSPAWAAVIAYALVFFGTIMVTTLIAQSLRRILTIGFAGWVDTLFGGVAGLAKGAAICAVILALLTALMPDAPFLSQSRLVPYIRPVSKYLKDFIRDPKLPGGLSADELLPDSIVPENILPRSTPRPGEQPADTSPDEPPPAVNPPDESQATPI